jgi:hypothetical protein
MNRLLQTTLRQPSVTFSTVPGAMDAAFNVVTTGERNSSFQTPTYFLLADVLTFPYRHAVNGLKSEQQT